MPSSASFCLKNSSGSKEEEEADSVKVEVKPDSKNVEDGVAWRVYVGLKLVFANAVLRLGGMVVVL